VAARRARLGPGGAAFCSPGASARNTSARRPGPREELSSLLANDCLGRPLEQIIHSMAVSALSSTEAEGGRLGSYRIVANRRRRHAHRVSAVRADDEYQQQVAIKVVTQGRETLQSVERFRRERQILASLEHPTSPAAGWWLGQDRGLREDTPYLVMELVEGEPVTTTAFATTST